MSLFDSSKVFGDDNRLQFTITYQQFLDASGSAVQAIPEGLIDQDSLIKAYETMVLIRAFDQKAIALQRTGKLGTYPSVLGQEAIGTAIGMAMHKDDIFAPYYRDFATQYLRGVGLDEMLLYWGGSEQGSAYRNCPNDFPVCVPIATQFGHASGAAVAIKASGKKQATVVTSGEGATSKGDFLETLNLAGAWQLPLVMVINNNQWAISTPRDIQSGSQTIAQKAIGAGIEGIVVDGNCFLSVKHAMDKALARAYAGKGATLIEAVSYRLGDHTTADDATRYRSNKELKEAWDREPIQRLKCFIQTQFGWSDSQERALNKSVKSEVNKAVEDYLSVPNEPAEAMFDFLFERLPEPLKEQYAHARLLSLSPMAHSIKKDVKNTKEAEHE